MALVICTCSPAGAASNSASSVRLTSRDPPHKITAATVNAASASANTSHGTFHFSPAHTRQIPVITTIVLHTSVEKCKASASSASLEYFAATRESFLDRVISMESATSNTRIAVTLG